MHDAQIDRDGVPVLYAAPPLLYRTGTERGSKTI